MRRRHRRGRVPCASLAVAARVRAQTTHRGAVSEVRIAAEPRTEFGKGGARRTRRAGKIPAVLYGHGTDPRHIVAAGPRAHAALKGGANALLPSSSTASERAGPAQGDPARPDQAATTSTSTCCSSAAARRSPSRSRSRSPARPPATALVDQQLITADRRGRGHPHPGPTRGRHRRASSVGTQHHRRRPSRCRSGTTLVSDPEPGRRRASLAAPTAEQLEAELAEAEAEAGIERDEPTEQAEEAAAAEEDRRAPADE